MRLARAYLGRLKQEEDEASDDDSEEGEEEVDGVERRLQKDSVSLHRNSLSAASIFCFTLTASKRNEQR